MLRETLAWWNGRHIVGIRWKWLSGTVTQAGTLQGRRAEKLSTEVSRHTYTALEYSYLPYIPKLPNPTGMLRLYTEPKVPTPSRANRSSALQAAEHALGPPISGRTADKGDEHAALHSITSSARAITACGKSRPMVRAVF